MTKPPFKARIHVLLASHSPLAVVIRRGPSKRVCTMAWDRSTDEFRLGQWLRGRIYPLRSDLSPDGKYLLYFALNGKWKNEAEGSWTAISRAPYLKAIALFPQGDTWFGGGLFTGEQTYWVNSCSTALRDTDEVCLDPSFRPTYRCGGQFPNLYENRLSRDGWMLVNASGIETQSKIANGFERIWSFCQRFLRSSDEQNTSMETQVPQATVASTHLQARFDVYEKRLPGPWILRKFTQGVERPPRELARRDEGHELVNRETGAKIALPDWEWADLDGERLVWATDGKLFAAKLDIEGLADVVELHDFDKMTFEPIIAPY